MHNLPSGREMADIAIVNGAIDMAQGVVHTAPPTCFQEVLNELFSDRRFHIYASPAGYKPYREALYEILRQERPSLSLQSVMATNGVTGGLVSALRSRCKPLDGVLVMEPFYPAHDWAVQSLHCVTKYAPYNPDFSVNIGAIEKLLPDVSAFILGNPANPTGTVLQKEELVKIYSLCRQYNVLLILDEVYKDFVWEGNHYSPLSFTGDLDNIVVLRSFSKNLALAGWRAGYAITSPERRAHMTHIHDALYVGAPAAPQFILARLLENNRQELDSFVNRILKQYRENRTAIIEAFKSFGMTPMPKEGAYYMIVKHNRADDAEGMKILLEKGIATAPGSPFFRPGTGNTGYLRVHYAQSKENKDKIVAILTS